jgi:hypothetical protein
MRPFYAVQDNIATLQIIFLVAYFLRKFPKYEIRGHK